MVNAIRKNEKCFVGLPTCGYGFESAKLCFVACPSDERYIVKLELIKSIVESKQYECHIALKRIDPGNFAFCTKICSKIVQSQFCIVLLDPSIDEKNVEHYNPNVHMEYGMMLSQNKHIIPLQNEKYELPFNIAPLDTIKYSEANFKTKVTEAIDSAVNKFSEKQIAGQVPQGPEIFTFYNLFGYHISDIAIQFHKLLYDHGAHLGFYLFNFKDKLKFIGPFDHEDPKKIILHTKLLIDNLVATYESLILNRPKNEKENKFSYLIDKISIDIIVPPFFSKEDVFKRIKDRIPTTYNYPIKVYYRTDIKDRVEKEYEEIGDITPVQGVKSEKKTK